MQYRLTILDNNYYMYLDMALQLVTMIENCGDQAEIITYEDVHDNTVNTQNIFLGTSYSQYIIPTCSIVTNFDNHNILFTILTDHIIKSCIIWDYSRHNIDLTIERFPEADCHLLELGYSKLIDYDTKYEEEEKDIDVLFLGNVSERRNIILTQLEEKGVNVVREYRKYEQDRANLIKRAKICLSIYSETHLHTISSSRFAPILSNNGFIVTETCTDQYQETKWSEYLVSANYENIVDTTIDYLNRPKDRKISADHYYETFKKNNPPIVTKIH
jgi:hypothetical protein